MCIITFSCQDSIVHVSKGGPWRIIKCCFTYILLRAGTFTPFPQLSTAHVDCTCGSFNHTLGILVAKALERTVYPKKYAHGFVVLCFVVVMQSFIMNSHEVFIHIHQGCFAGTGAIVRLPQCQWSKPDGYGKISQCVNTTKHSKSKTVCIFPGIYCTTAILTYSTFAVVVWILIAVTYRTSYFSEVSHMKLKPFDWLFMPRIDCMALTMSYELRRLTYTWKNIWTRRITRQSMVTPMEVHWLDRFDWYLHQGRNNCCQSNAYLDWQIRFPYIFRKITQFLQDQPYTYSENTST